MAGLAYGPEPSRPINEQELVQQLSLSVNHTGDDVRITTGQILSHKPPNHASVRVWWWQWKQLFNVKSNEVSHVNVLDMNMILLTLLWRCCNPGCVNLHLEDSLVSRLIVCKGRTSSALWQPLCNRDENPTGAASRLQSVAAPPMPRTCQGWCWLGVQEVTDAKRAGISLKSLSTTQKTRQRYESAVGLILLYLVDQEDKEQGFDYVISEWVEAQWVRGESVNTIADCLSGLHSFMPELKGTLRQAWRLFRTCGQVESPRRAPPITLEIVKAIVALAFEKGDLAFGALVALGFHTLLRTGEMLPLQHQDLEFNLKFGVVTLLSSKTALRKGSEEAVAIRDELTLELLATLVAVHSPAPGAKIWPFSGRAFRDLVRSHLRFFRVMHLGFKHLQTLFIETRGATFLLQEGVPLDVILVRARWRSLAVARLYLEDGLAQLPKLRVPPSDRHRLHSYSKFCPFTAFRPW